VRLKGEEDVASTLYNVGPGLTGFIFLACSLFVGDPDRADSNQGLAVLAISFIMDLI
jgi:hypothetical protein